MSKGEQHRRTKSPSTWYLLTSSRRMVSSSSDSSFVRLFSMFYDGKIGGWSAGVVSIAAALISRGDCGRPVRQPRTVSSRMAFAVVGPIP